MKYGQAFKPMLGSNDEFNINELTYPLIALYKYDGIRGELKEGNLVSRELKPIPNEKVQEHKDIKLLKELSIKYNCIIDAELYIHGIPFNEHAIFIMTRQYDRKHSNKIKARLRKGTLNRPYHFYMRLPKEFKPIVFDVFSKENPQLTFEQRHKIIQEWKEKYNINVAKSKIINSAKELQAMYDKAIDEGFEGLVVRGMSNVYKFGRSTVKEQGFLKMKPYTEFIGKVLRIEQRKKNLTESHTNALGYKVKESNKDNMVTTGIAAVVVTEFNGHEIKITLNGSEEFRREVWEKKEEYVAYNVKYSGFYYGSLNVPRHPTFKGFI